MEHCWIRDTPMASLSTCQLDFTDFSGNLVKSCRRDSKFTIKNDKLIGTSAELELVARDVEWKGLILIQLKRGFDALEEKLKDIEAADVSRS